MKKVKEKKGQGIMTPLEIALQQKAQCNDTTEINGVLYCNKTGKIIHPSFVKNKNGVLVCDIKKCRNRTEE